MYVENFTGRYRRIPVAYVSKEYAPGEFISCHLHRHREIELLLVRQGAVRYWLEENCVRLTAGDTVCVSPWVLHRAAAADGMELHHCCLCFDPSVLQDAELEQELLDGTRSLSPVLRSPEAARWLEAAYSACETQAPGWEFAVRGYLLLFFSVLRQNGGILTGKRSREGFAPRVVNWLEEHYPEPLTSHQAAQDLFLSQSYFCRRFHAVFGQPFQRYYLLYRLDRSLALLRETDMPISRVAEATGFDSFSYFSRSFRERYGVSPSDYRRNTREMLLEQN